MTTQERVNALIEVRAKAQQAGEGPLASALTAYAGVAGLAVERAERAIAHWTRNMHDLSGYLRACDDILAGILAKVRAA